MVQVRGSRQGEPFSAGQLAQEQQERHRIGPARQSDNRTGTPRKQPESTDCAPNGIA